MARVLIVEDDVDLAQSLKDWLTRQGHIVDLATGVNQALATIAVVVPDLLITDFGMGPPTGEELLRVVAARHPSVCRVLYSASGDEDTRAARQMADVVLRKDCELSELKRAIDHCVTRSLAS
jgi:DNA-binding response OmpR family regulator